MNRAIISLAVLLAAQVSLMADGFMVAPRVQTTSKQILVASPRQEALLATDGQEVQVTLRTYFRSGPKELAWVVPVPQKPDKVGKADESIFQDLEELTAPKFTWERPGGGGLSCGCSAPAGATFGGHSIRVESSGTAGVFDYVVLAAKDSSELVRWLNDNHYYVPAGSERVLDQYVRGNWHWLAMKVRAEEALKPTLAPHPITYTYRDSRLLYPLTISQLSADLTNEIVLYVAAPSRYVCANWTNGAIDPKVVRREHQTPSGTNYEQLFLQQVQASDGKLFVTEYFDACPLANVDTHVQGVLRGPAGSQWRMTRLRTILTPRAMDHDVMLVPMQSHETVHSEFDLSSAASPERAVPLAAAGAAILALCLGLFLRNFAGLGRVASIGCLVAGCLILTMV